MIRPSALIIAEDCGLAPRLAEQFPETSPAADRGTGGHGQIAEDLRGGKAATMPEAIAAVALVKDIPGDTFIEHAVTLRDPETNEVITEGTVDWANVYEIPGVPRRYGVRVRDWKFGRMENVPPPDENLQVLSYALAMALKVDAVEFQPILSFPGLSGVAELEGRTYQADEWWPVLDRVRAAARKEAVAVPGPHCSRCYQRHHCPAWRDRATTAIAAILGRSTDVTLLSDDQASEMAVRLDAVDKAAEMARDLLKSHVRNGGRIEAGGKVWQPSQRAGRSTPDLDALKAMGIEVPMKVGKPFEVWSWQKARP